MTITNLQKQSAELARNRQKPARITEKVRLEGIKTAEGLKIEGLTQGSSEAVRVWAPHQMTGVEVPPDRPGLAVIKRVSVTEAEPGDTVTYVIIYRNMGNTPIKNVTIADSLLPRLEYVKGTSRGPEGTEFQLGNESRGLDRAALAASRRARPGGRWPRLVQCDHTLKMIEKIF